MADKKVSIKIDTTANTKGAQDASKALDKVSASEKEVARSADLADNTIAGMRAEVARLTTELENTNLGSQEFIQKASQLDSAQKRLGTTLNTSGAGFKNVGSLIGQAGFQIQDFTVQVGAGTSALTALSQQGSQLLGVFGPGGAVAGALLAIGAIAAKMFVPAELEMGRFLENIDEVAKLAAEGISENFEKVLEGIERQAARATELAGVYDGVKEASDRYSQSELDNSAKRREALILINQLLGVQRDTLLEMQEQQDAEAAKRLLTTQQQIAAQNEITAKAQKSLEINEETFSRDGEALANLRNQLVLETQKLELFRQQRAELEAQQRNAPSAAENLSDAFFPNDVIVRRRVEARRATSTLGSEGPQLNVDTSEAKVDVLAEKIKELEKTLTRAAQGLLAEGERAQVAASIVETEIAKINETSRTEELIATVENAKATLKLGNDSNIAGLQSLIEESKPINESQKFARDQVAQALADGQITAQEVALIAQQLPILLRTLSATNQTVLSNFGVVENNLKNYQIQLTEVQRRLQDLSRQAGKPTN